MKKEFIADTLQHIEDNLYEIPYKLVKDNLLDAVIKLNNLIKQNKQAKSHQNNVHNEAMTALKRIL